MIQCDEWQTVCFDIEADYVRIEGWQNAAYTWALVAQRRRAGTPICAHAAALVDATTGACRVFVEDELAEFAELLVRAPRLVSYNGKRWDIPVISQYVRSKLMRERLRRRITELPRARVHCDLMELSRYYGFHELAELNMTAAEAVASRGELDRFEREYEAEGFTEKIPRKLAKARRDATRTACLWQLLERGTFRYSRTREPCALTTCLSSGRTKTTWGSKLAPLRAHPPRQRACRRKCKETLVARSRPGQRLSAKPR